MSNYNIDKIFKDKKLLKEFCDKYMDLLDQDRYKEVWEEVNKEGRYSDNRTLFIDLCLYVLDVNILEYIGDVIPSSFFYAKEIESIVIPSNIKEIQADAFESCKELKSVDMSKSNVTNIRSNAFAQCEKLSSVTLPDTLEALDNRVFYNCSSLNDIFLPDSLKRVGYDVFQGCPDSMVVQMNRGVDRSEGPEDPHPKGIKGKQSTIDFLSKHIKWANA